MKYSLRKLKNKNLFKRHKYPSPNALNIKYFWTLSYNHWAFLVSLNWPILKFKKKRYAEERSGCDTEVAANAAPTAICSKSSFETFDHLKIFHNISCYLEIKAFSHFKITQRTNLKYKKMRPFQGFGIAWFKSWQKLLKNVEKWNFYDEYSGPEK